MRFHAYIAAAFVLCAVAASPAQAQEMNAFEHSEQRVQLAPEVAADIQAGIEEMLLLTAADEVKGEGIKKKIISDLKAFIGKGDGTSDDTGTQPDADLTARHAHFSKQGWKMYMQYVKEGQLFLKKLSAQYEMGNGLIIMSGMLDEKSPRYWMGPEGQDTIVLTAKGQFTCRAMDTLMCDNKFRLYVTFTPPDAEGFGDVVIRAWMVEFLNDKGRPVNKN